METKNRWSSQHTSLNI